MDQVKKKISPLMGFFNGMGERRLTVFATSGCYYIFMSLVPAVMVLCCLLPYTPFSQELMLTYVDAYFSASLGTIVRKIVEGVYASNTTTMTVSILLTVFSASASMRAIMNGLDAAYDIRQRRSLPKQFLMGVFFVILLLITLILALGVMVYGGRIVKLLSAYLPQVEILESAIFVFRFLVIMVLLFLIFAMIYTFMPSGRMKLLQQLPGALFCSAVWVIFSYLFSRYVEISDKYGAYGFIGTIMVAMLWMNFCFYFLLIGGYINSLLMQRRANKRKEQ